MFLALCERLVVGHLTVRMPDGTTHAFAGPEAGPRATLILHRMRAVRRFLLGGTLGLAESYMDGDWDTPDLAALLTLGANNEDRLGEMLYGRRVAAALARVWHRLRPNTRSGSQRNIAYHYDLGNAFYAKWLDPTLTYSSAVFTAPEQPLDQAQINKYRHIAEFLRPAPGQSVLEIGCGWGGFARFLAREYDCRVTGITISREQLALNQRRIQEEGLGEKVEVRFSDYRDVQGRFDRIASIEMFEAVGESYWPAFFGKIRDCLTPDGRAALQVITISDKWFDKYRRSADFIQRYIFPGGMLPSPSAFRRATDAAGLTVEGERFFGQHYARTLAEWNTRFQRAWPEIVPLGFDLRFKRMWEFYLAYCEAGFRQRSIDVAQYALARR